MSTALSSQRSQSVGTSAVQIGGYTAPSVTTGTIISGLTIANRTGSNCFATCYILSGSSVITYIIVTAPVLAGGNLVVADEGTRFVLNSGDAVYVLSSLASSLDVIMSVAQIT